MVCSLGHEDEISPFRSRMKIASWEETAQSVPINCRQCEEAPCRLVCPVQAISKDPELGSQVVDNDKCIGCRSCVLLCPFGAMAFSAKTGKVFTCDLCRGDPLCVKFCAYGALEFVATNEMHQDRITRAAENILMAQKKVEQQE